MQEKTFFMIKPDGVSRGLTEEILKRVRQIGLKVIAQQELLMTDKLASDLYSPHYGKPFYNGLLRFITSGSVFCTIVEGEAAIARIRALMGATDPSKAEAGTIRGDLKEENFISEYGAIKNVVHGSDSPSSAKREMNIFFKEGA